jgi:uncharacterized protein
MEPVFLQGIGLMLVLITGILVLIWFSRRKARGDRPITNKKHGLFYVLRLVAFALLSLVIVIFSTAVFVSYLSALEDMRPSPSQVNLPPDLPFSVETVTFPGGDGSRLAGWYVPPQNGATIILLHGYGGNRTDLLWHAGVLVQAGYGVLLYDEHASGESEGDHRSYGWEDPADVGGALDYLDGLPGTGFGMIGIAGCSIGGQIALQAAVDYPQIAAVWADGPSPVTTSDMKLPPGWFNLLVTPVNHVVDWLTALKLGIQVPRAMIDTIGSLEPRPVMMVAGGRPQPLIGSEAYYIEFMAQHAGAHTQLWVIPEAVHCNGPTLRPQEYANRLVEFFNTAFGMGR